MMLFSLITFTAINRTKLNFTQTGHLDCNLTVNIKLVSDFGVISKWETFQQLIKNHIKRYWLKSRCKGLWSIHQTKWFLNFLFCELCFSFKNTSGYQKEPSSGRSGYFSHCKLQTNLRTVIMQIYFESTRVQE